MILDFPGCQGHPQAAVRPDRVSTRAVQHRGPAGPHHLHLRHHRHDPLRTRQAHGRAQRPGQLRDLREEHAAPVQVIKITPDNTVQQEL